MKKCLYCGETEAAIRKHQLFCGGVDAYTGEATWERARHRFKPFTEKELKAIEADELEAVKQMGEFAEYVENQAPTKTDKEDYKE